MSTTSEQIRDPGSRTPLAGADRPTLCFFYSPTSGPSRRVEAFLAHVLQRGKNHRTFAVQRVNCDEHPELVERYAVKRMPTLIVIENRRVLGRLEGPCGRREIEELLEPWLGREAERGRMKGSHSRREPTPRFEPGTYLEMPLFAGIFACLLNRPRARRVVPSRSCTRSKARAFAKGLRQMTIAEIWTYGTSTARPST